MAKAGYSAPSAAVVALAAATAKSVIGVSAPAQFGVDLVGYRLGFDGVTSTAIPVQFELCYATFATNGPGTNSTSITPQQIRGRSITAGFTAASNWTAEPTVLTVIDSYSIAAFNGLVIYDSPFGSGGNADSAVSNGFVIRLTAPAIVNVRPTLFFERC
jgi:hypothetical protein